MLSQSGIYQIRCVPTGHRYIGGAKNLEQRRRHHWHRLEDGRCHNKVLQFAWDVFGADSFTFEVIERCPVARLRKRELHYLSVEGESLFNILRDARRPPTFSQEVRRKLAAKARLQHRQKNFGRHTWRSK